MDATRFDALTRGLAAPASRRAVGRVLAGFGLAGLVQTVALSPGAAKNRKKGKKRKGQDPKFNTFGCVDVGAFCKNGGQCCSGICSGKKSKKTCQGHNIAVGACEAGPLGFCAAPPPGGGLVVGTPCTSSADENGFCFTTTGNAPYCAVNTVQDAGCVACKKDKDCQRFCGPDAACIQCPGCEALFGVSTACAGSDDSCVV